MPPILLSLQLSLVSTVLLLFVGVPLGYWLAHSKSRVRGILDLLVCLPLVLPPTVLGLYLLLTFSRHGWLGNVCFTLFGDGLAFTFPGLVAGAFVFSLPFMVLPVKAGFQNLPASLREASHSLGKAEWETFWRVLLPNVRLPILSGVILCMAHTMGEFGVSMMIGGNIPGITRVASIEIYSRAEALDFSGAHRTALLLAGVSLFLLFLLSRLGRRRDAFPTVHGRIWRGVGEVR
jgi:molybdate transport system permease protein